MKTGRPKHSGARLYDMGGEQFTALQLAQLAQCSAITMTARLRRYSAAQAVAMGKADKHRERAPQTYDTPHGRAPHTKFYALGSESLTVDELAERAGCPRRTMITRLRTHKPESAVALGPSNSNRPRKADFRIVPERAPKPEPAKTRPASSDALSASDWKAAALKKDKRALPASLKAKAPTGQAIMLPGAKITRAAPIPDRFAVDPATCPPIFSGRRYGEHEDTGTAIARQYG